MPINCSFHTLLLSILTCLLLYHFVIEFVQIIFFSCFLFHTAQMYTSVRNNVCHWNSCALMSTHSASFLIHALSKFSFCLIFCFLVSNSHSSRDKHLCEWWKMSFNYLVFCNSIRFSTLSVTIIIVVLLILCHINSHFLKVTFFVNVKSKIVIFFGTVCLLFIWSFLFSFILLKDFYC